MILESLTLSSTLAENGVEFLRMAVKFVAMLNRRNLLRSLLCASFMTVSYAEGATARIKKVLPHYLDRQGRHMLAPSLYERDAYQAHLRRNPTERSALRFDVNWKARGFSDSNLKLRLELRGSKGSLASPLVLELPVRSSAVFSKWSALTLKEEDYEKLGELIAWRATLWHGETQIAEQKSFLW